MGRLPLLVDSALEKGDDLFYKLHPSDHDLCPNVKSRDLSPWSFLGDGMEMADGLNEGRMLELTGVALQYVMLGHRVAFM